MVGVEGVPRTLRVGGDAQPEAEDLAAELKVLRDDDRGRHRPTDDGHGGDDPEQDDDPLPLAARQAGDGGDDDGTVISSCSLTDRGR